MGEHLLDSFFVVVHDVSAESDDWLHDELDEASLECNTIFTILFGSPFLSLGIIEVVTPKFLHHLVEINLEFVSVDFGESGKGEGPSEESGTESDGTLAWINLLTLSHIISFIG